MTHPPVAAPPRRRPSAQRGRGQGRLGALFIAPFFVLFAAFSLVPIGYAAYLSLFSRQASGLGLGSAQEVFVGLDNYVRAFTDTTYLRTFGNIGLYIVVYIPTMIALALLIALLLDSAASRARAFFRVSFYLPNIVPALVASVIWLYLYTPGVSPLIDVFEGLGGTWNLGSLAAGIGALANLAIWLHTGYNVILFYAALQSVPHETLEAATIDGAGAVRTALSVKAPMIAGAVRMAVLFTVVGAMQIFAEPLLLRSRATAITSGWTPNMYVYQTAFQRHDYGYAAATALILAVTIGVMSYFVTRSGSKDDR